MNWEDGYTYKQERLHRLWKKQQLEEELADYDYQEELYNEYTI